MSASDSSIDSEMELAENITRLNHQLVDINEQLSAVKELTSEMAPAMAEVVNDLANMLNNLDTSLLKPETLELFKKLLENSDSLLDLVEASIEAKQVAIEMLPALSEIATDMTEQISELGNQIATPENKAVARKAMASTGTFAKAIDILLELDERGVLDQVPDTLDLVFSLKELLFEMTPTGEMTPDVSTSVSNLGEKIATEENKALVKRTADAAPVFVRIYDNILTMAENGTLERLVGVLNKLSEPKVLNLLEGTVDSLASLETSSPRKVGMLGIMGEMRDSEMQKTLGIVFELAKKLPGNIKR